MIGQFNCIWKCVDSMLCPSVRRHLERYLNKESLSLESANVCIGGSKAMKQYCGSGLIRQ